MILWQLELYVSPLAGSGFFFFDKRNKTLKPCTDYHDFNKTNAELISSAFEPLCGVTILMKLELHNAYNTFNSEQIEIDQ